jgi:hypothetical protein
MKLTRQEIEDELAHKNNLIRALRARLRPLELQAAQKGMNTPPEILTEISTLYEQVRVQEEEISRLESLAAEGQLSLAEAEYRMILAEAWDTPIGRPMVAGAARLELTRLKMGLSTERSGELEREVRIALVEEIFLKIDIAPLLGRQESMAGIGSNSLTIGSYDNAQTHIDTVVLNQQVTLLNPLESALRLIGKAIRLDPHTALKLFLLIWPGDATLDLAKFQDLLFTENKVWIHRDEHVIFDTFITDLSGSLNTRMLPSP